MENDLKNAVDAKNSFLNSLRGNFNQASTPNQENAMKESLKNNKAHENGIGR